MDTKNDEWVEVTPMEYLKMKAEDGKKKREELKRRVATVIRKNRWEKWVNSGEIAEKILQEIEGSGRGGNR